MTAKTTFCHTPKMLIYANKLENSTANLFIYVFIYFTKRCITDIWAITKKSGRKIFTRFNRSHEKQNVGSKWTPLYVNFHWNL